MGFRLNELFIYLWAQKWVAFFPPGQTYFAAWGERRRPLKQSEEEKREKEGAADTILVVRRCF